MWNCGIFVLLITFHKAIYLALTQECSEFGAVRLTSNLPNVGQVNFCNGSQWGTICSDGWDHFDAAVVCRELGYTADGAQPAYYSSYVDDPIIIVIENVTCSWDEPRLRDCPYSIPHSCQNGRVAGVRCRVIKNINFATVSNSVLVTWEYNNITSHQPSSFDVRCNGQRHYNNYDISVSNGTSRLSDIVGDLLPNVSYDCCVSANYARPGGSIITTEIRCASIRSEDLLTPTDMFIISGTCANMTATIVVSAVLGCVIVILLVLLSVCGGALLRSRTSPEAPKRSSAEMAINRNVSYETTEMIVNRNISYETIADLNHPLSRQQPLPSERNQASATSVSENYFIEYLEPHQATGGGGEKGEAQHEDYLQLQH